MHPILDILRNQLLPAVRSGQIRIAPSAEAKTLDPSDFLELSMNYPQCHSFFEWFWMVEGNAYMKVEAKVHPLSPGDFCFLSPGTSHVDVYDRETSAYRSLWFFYSARYLHVNIFEYRPFGQWSSQEYASFPSEIDLGLQLEALRSETEHSQSYSEDIAAGLLLQIMASVARSLERAIQLNEANSTRIGIVSGHVNYYLRTHYAEPLTLADIARSMHLNPHYLVRRFKFETGTTVFEKLAQIRIEQATRLVLEKRLPLDEIAAAVGYNSVDHFSRVFRKIKGVPPSRYGLNIRDVFD